MLTIKKRTVPNLSRGILRKESTKSRVSRKVGFADDIGKPLVEYWDLSPVEDYSTGSIQHVHEKTSGQPISTWRVENQINRMKWIVCPVKNVKPLKAGSSEMRMIEEKRLEENNISRAPLFGSFDAFEPPNLISDAIIRARAPIPIIPIGKHIYDIPKLPPSQHTYQQIFEEQQPESVSIGSTGTTNSVFDLMAQLKQRGLIPEERLGSTSEIANPMLQPVTHRQTRWSNSEWKTNKVCNYYINRQSGCTRGNLCKFMHDDAQRALRQQELHDHKLKNESWRPQNSRQRQMSSRGSGNKGRIRRSRSPHSRD